MSNKTLKAMDYYVSLKENRRARRPHSRRRILPTTLFVILLLSVIVTDIVAEISPSPSGSSGDEVVTSSTFRTGGDEDVASSPSGGGRDEASAPESPHGESKARNVLIEMVCKYTDYEELCVKSLNRIAQEKATTKDIVRAIVKVVVDAISDGFEHSDRTLIDSESTKGAVEVCRAVHHNIVYDLNKTLATIDMHSIEDLPGRVDDLNTWVGAAIAYQETCIESYPKGKMQRRMRMLLKSATDLADNALAILDNISKFIGSLNRRFLVGGEYNEDLPPWIHENERRIIMEDPTFDFIPNVTIARDGSGDFKTIYETLKYVPKESIDRYVIYVKEGLYDEPMISLPKEIWNVTMYGDGPTKTVITGSKNYVDGVKTFFTATVSVCGEGFMAVGIGFENTAGPEKYQAVALLVHADHAIFVSCRMSAYQDTLYAHSERQFYYNCEISGTIDFIFGDSRTLFQNCTIITRKGLSHQRNVILAQGRKKKNERTAFVLHKCKLIAEPKLAAVISEYESYLGRPWQQYARNIIMESDIGGFIYPDGYMPWQGNFALHTLTYLEYGNTGPGADTSKRVSWPGVKSITAEEAQRWTAESFLGASEWVTPTGTPFHAGLYSCSVSASAPSNLIPRALPPCLLPAVAISVLLLGGL